MVDAGVDTGQYVIWVDFEIHPEAMPDFVTLLRENAQTSLASEPGCRRFDVLVPAPVQSAISLYEIYDDEAAFNAHLESAHYRSFAASAASAIRSKAVRAFHLQSLVAPEEQR